MTTKTKELKDTDSVVRDTVQPNEMSPEELLNYLMTMDEPTALEITLGRGASYQDTLVIGQALFGGDEDTHRRIIRKIGIPRYKRAAKNNKLEGLVEREELLSDDDIERAYNSATLRDRMYDLRRQMRGLR